jgi:hypothetical protein
VAKAALPDYVDAMTKMRLLILGAICVALLSGAPSFAAKKSPPPPNASPPAADPGLAKSLGSVGSWTAYLAQNKTGRVCYLVGQPEKTDPSIKRKAVMAMVTHRTEDNVSNVVSFDEGYPLNEDDDVIVEIGSDKFPLFARDDTAWARTAELDKTIVAALTKGKGATVKASPKKGRGTTDTYALSGFSKALELIDKACDIKR